MSQSSGLPLSTRVSLYFTDLSFYTRSTLGVGERAKLQVWLVACFAAFALGVFCRQLIDMSKFPTVSLKTANLSLSTFSASFIVGLAIFPFLVRHVRKLADYVTGWEKKPVRVKAGAVTKAEASSHGTWNLIHVFTSFSTGFFVNLAYEKMLQIIHTQLG